MNVKHTLLGIKNALVGVVIEHMEHILLCGVFHSFFPGKAPRRIERKDISHSKTLSQKRIFRF